MIAYGFGLSKAAHFLSYVVILGSLSLSRSNASKLFLILQHNAKTMIDRKSTRLNSSHTVISYAVFCLKKKKKSNNYTVIL